MQSPMLTIALLALWLCWWMPDSVPLCWCQCGSHHQIVICYSTIAGCFEWCPVPVKSVHEGTVPVCKSAWPPYGWMHFGLGHAWWIPLHSEGGMLSWLLHPQCAYPGTSYGCIICQCTWTCPDLWTILLPLIAIFSRCYCLWCMVVQCVCYSCMTFNIQLLSLANTYRHIGECQSGTPARWIWLVQWVRQHWCVVLGLGLVGHDWSPYVRVNLCVHIQVRQLEYLATLYPSPSKEAQGKKKCIYILSTIVQLYYDMTGSAWDRSACRNKELTGQTLVRDTQDHVLLSIAFLSDLNVPS
jgi:hypothetical protein